MAFPGWRVFLSCVAGLALAFAFPNYNLPPLGWVSVAGLMLASIGAGLGEAALCGFLYGVAFYTFTIPWVYTVLRDYGPLLVWQAAGVLGLVVIMGAFFWAFFGAVIAWTARRSLGLALLLAPFLWVALELGRTRMPGIGFPWNLLGYTASGSLALLQLTSFTGIYGLSLLVAAYNACFIWWLRSPAPRSWRLPTSLWLGFTAAILVVVFVGRSLVPAAQPAYVAHLVQTNLPQALDYPANWDALHAGDMAELDRISIAAGAKQPGLVIWPEVPAPFSLQQAAFAQRAERIAQESHGDFLFGVIDWKPSGKGDPAASNSAVLLDPAGREEFLYDKIHLVPVGEFVPLRRYLWFAKDLTALVGDFRRGTRYSVGQLLGGRFSVFICYEAIFPDAVRRFVRNGAELLINISNDGWFGRSAARAQHLAMARVRAVENRRWLLRDTNNGFTVSVDPYGRIVARLAPDIRGELDAPYAFRDDTTPYTRWGDWVAELSVGMSVLLFTVAGLRRRPTQAKQTK